MLATFLPIVEARHVVARVLSAVLPCFPGLKRYSYSKEAVDPIDAAEPVKAVPLADVTS